MGMGAANSVAGLSTASVRPLKMLSQYQPPPTEEAAMSYSSVMEGSACSLQGSSPVSLPLNIRMQAPSRVIQNQHRAFGQAEEHGPRRGMPAMDSLEKAFLASTDTPPFEQLLGPAAETSPPGQAAVLASSSFRRAAFTDHRKAPGGGGLVPAAAATVAPPLVSRQPGAAPAAHGNLNWADIQGMRICKVKMPPLPPVSNIKQQLQGGSELKLGEPAAVSQLPHAAGTADRVRGRRSEEQQEGIAMSRAEEPAAAQKRIGGVAGPADEGPQLDALPVLGSVASTDGGSAWLGRLVPAATVPDTGGAYKVFLARLSEGRKGPAMPAATQKQQKWGYVHTRLVLRSCKTSNVDDMAAQLDEEIFKAALLHG